MAKLYGEIAAKSLLTLDKSFARANGQPLDASEVYYSLTAAQEYAAGAQAYIGQKIVVIENGVVTHYGIEDAAGNLKELGSKPVADGTTVTIDENGKITLANIEEEQATGTYNAVLVNGVLTWVKPSETTVEGLSDLIQALTGRVDDNQDAIEEEVLRAKAAEAANAKAITDLEASVAEQIANAVANLLNGAPEAYDTLKEISDWIASHPNEVASLNTSIKANSDAIDALELLVGDKAVATQITEALADYVTATTLEDYVKSADVTEIHNQVGTNKIDIANLTTRIDGIVAQGGEPNLINTIKVNGQSLIIEDKAVNVTVPTKVSDLTDDTGFDGRITAAQTQADKGVSDAATAQSAAEAAQSTADNNKTVLDGHVTKIANLETAKGDHAQRISALEQADLTHKTEYETLNGIVSNHTTAIAGAATQTALNTAIADIAKNTAAVQTLNETTIPDINAAIAGKADANKVYTKTEIGTLADGKTLVQMVEDAQTAATYDDTAIKALITAEETRAKGAENALDQRLAATETFFAAVENPDEVIDTLAEIVTYIENDKSGAADMLGSIGANTAAIAAINHADTGILAVAKKYADDKIAGIPTATAEALGLVKFDDVSIKMNASNQLYVAKVSTDVLEQGTQVLVLNGGTAEG